MKSAVSFGFSKILARYSVSSMSLVAANEAVRLGPSDAEAYQARARILSRMGFELDASKDIEIAVSLRPRHNSLWLESGNLREANGDAESALIAFDTAVRLSPYYGHSRWQRGNLLIRMGRYEEGFNDLREATTKNSQFLPGLIDLAWGISRGDPNRTEQLIGIRDDQARLTYVRFLARKGRGAEALQELQGLSTAISGVTREELITFLIQTKCYREAFVLWRGTSPNPTNTRLIQNGSFEDDLNLDESGFGWRLLQHELITFALDVNAAENGARSLRISFSGFKDRSAVLSQLLPVEADQTYQISFAFKTQDLVTAGVPILQVVEADSGQILGSSAPLQTVGGNWTKGELDFKTGPVPSPLMIRLVREDCNEPVCPIFGHLWIDSFVLVSS